MFSDAINVRAYKYVCGVRQQTLQYQLVANYTVMLYVSYLQVIPLAVVHHLAECK